MSWLCKLLKLLKQEMPTSNLKVMKRSKIETRSLRSKLSLKILPKLQKIEARAKFKSRRNLKSEVKQNRKLAKQVKGRSNLKATGWSLVEIRSL